MEKKEKNITFSITIEQNNYGMLYGPQPSRVCLSQMSFFNISPEI